MNLDEWKFSFEVAWDDPWYRWQTIVTAAAALLGSVFFLWRLIPEGLQSGLLVFHYNLYLGIDEVMSWKWIFVLPLVLFTIIAADIIAAGFLFRKDRIMSRVALCSATLFTLLALIGGFFLVTVNV